jgi:LAS superfamily LD-carboxypeptidase LdcB
MKKNKLIGVMIIGLIVVSVSLPVKEVVLNLFDIDAKAASVNATATSPLEEKWNNIQLPNTETANNEEDLISEEEIDYLVDTTYTDESGKLIIKNVDDILVLANKKRNLPSDYKPEDLVVPNVRFSFKEKLEKRYLRAEAAKALEELFKEAEKEEIILYAVSGYRSYNTQKGLFDRKVGKVGYEEANKLVAVPGQSEHQTGLAMDVSSKSANFSLEEIFGQTVEGKWLKNNAHRFGFIIRFQKEHVDITGYSFEPWHIRYVGEDVAPDIYEKNITLEEFLGDI